MRKLSTWSPLAICLAIALLTFFGSIWQGQYAIDHLHWGLMLSNAKDYTAGLIPYKDIYILYGFLTTLIQTIAYSWLGENLQSIIIITAFMYAVGLLLIYFLCHEVLNNQRIAICCVITCFMFHPIAIYPWSNYIAYPFLLVGLILNLRAKRSQDYFICGLFLGLAILAREGLAPAVALYIFASGCVDWLSKRTSMTQTSSNFVFGVIGLAIPIVMMLVYLMMNESFFYWHDISWYLPKLYAQEFFPHMKGLNLLGPLTKQLSYGIVNFDVRWSLVALMIIANIGIIIFALFNSQYRPALEKNIKLSIFSLALLSSSLHLAEIFRIATGSIIGIINIYYLLQKVRIPNIGFSLIAVALLSGITPDGSGHSFSTTNYFFPSKKIIQNAELVLEPSYFKGQKWAADARIFYSQVSEELTKIAAVCHIKFYDNQTYDAFLHILSPFEKLRLAPFYLSDQMESLRPDLIKHRRHLYDEAADLIIFKHVLTAQDSVTSIPTGFTIYKKYITPRTNFLYNNQDSLLIIVPTGCKTALSLPQTESVSR